MRLIEVECDATMRWRTATLVFAFDLAGFAGGFALHARGARQIPPSNQVLSAEERAHLLAKGRELFLSRCARCHGDNGSKPLRTGAPLSERDLTGEVVAPAVKGRLADSTEEERRGVAVYILSLMKTLPPDSSTTILTILFHLANFRAHVATGPAPAAQPRHVSIELLPIIEFAWGSHPPRP